MELSGYAVIDDSTADVIGFCQLKPYAPLSTFENTVETSYFLTPDATRKGIGTLMLQKLIEDARKLHKAHVVASISGDNIASINFHKKQGFLECGRFKNVGNKFNKDFDIVYMQRDL
jgi:phosphinothricin acetyltransferase